MNDTLHSDRTPSTPNNTQPSPAEKTPSTSSETPRIYITGASGSGVTTLGRALSSYFSIIHIDVDDYYWMPTERPFTEKRPPQERIKLIQEVQQQNSGWVLSGSFDGWGDVLITHADCIVFVYTPNDIRLDRLREREVMRYGSRILPDGDMFTVHKDFLEWASQYENPTFSGRNYARHKQWLSKQSLPVLEVQGTEPVDDLVQSIVHHLNTIETYTE